MRSTSIFFHNYYGAHEEWIEFFCEKMNTPFTIFYNIVGDSIHNMPEPAILNQRVRTAASGKYLQDIVLRSSPNQGKDIGGKMVLLDAFFREGHTSDHSLFLHDKKSPYKIQNQEWKNKLFRIIDPGFAQTAISLFEQQKDIGIVAAKDTITNEFDNTTGTYISKNASQLVRLQEEYKISSADHQYVAGTMFWARSQPLLDFFRRSPPLLIRETLEKGNVMDEFGGTITHAWERMLSWIILDQGYQLHGI